LAPIIGQSIIGALLVRSFLVKRCCSSAMKHTLWNVHFCTPFFLSAVTVAVHYCHSLARAVDQLVIIGEALNSCLAVDWQGLLYDVRVVKFLLLIIMHLVTGHSFAFDCDWTVIDRLCRNEFRENGASVFFVTRTSFGKIDTRIVVSLLCEYFFYIPLHSPSPTVLIGQTGLVKTVRIYFENTFKC